MTGHYDRLVEDQIRKDDERFRKVSEDNFLQELYLLVAGQMNVGHYRKDHSEIVASHVAAIANTLFDEYRKKLNA